MLWPTLHLQCLILYTAAFCCMLTVPGCRAETCASLGQVEGALAFSNGKQNTILHDRLRGVWRQLDIVGTRHDRRKVAICCCGLQQALDLSNTRWGRRIAEHTGSGQRMQTSLQIAA